MVVQAERKHRSHELEVQAYQHDWKQHVLRLKNYFERQGLQNVDPSGELSGHITGAMQPVWVVLAAQVLALMLFAWQSATAVKFLSDSGNTEGLDAYSCVAHAIDTSICLHLPEQLSPRPIARSEQRHRRSHHVTFVVIKSQSQLQ